LTALVLLVDGILQQVNNVSVARGVADSWNPTSTFIFVSSHALLYHRYLHLSCTCTCSPSFPCSKI